MALDLIVETTQPRPQHWQEIYKSLQYGTAPSSPPCYQHRRHGRPGLLGRNRGFNILLKDGSGFDSWNNTAQASAMTENLQISTHMALIYPSHLAISLVGIAGQGPWEETGGSIFCSQMALDLILETTQARPLHRQEIYKSLHIWHCSILATSLSASSAWQAGAPGKKQGVQYFAKRWLRIWFLKQHSPSLCNDRKFTILYSKVLFNIFSL